MKPISLEGQVIIVTGGAGSLGSAYCREIARRGGLLLINDLGCSVPGEGSDASAAEMVAEEIRSMGGQALANHDSVADSEGARRIVAAALDRFGRVDAVINSAGTMRFGPFEEVAAEDFAAVVDTHLMGSFHIASAVWPHMKAQGHGRIVLTASAAGLFGNRQMAAYASAKAGVAGLLNVLALEGEPHGIACNALLPTAVSKMANYVGAHSNARAANPAAERMARFMAPEYNAGLAVWLASAACTSNGAAYSSVGGRVARVLVGVGKGWRRDDQAPVTPEDIAAHLAEIDAAPEGFREPRGVAQEFAIVLDDMA